MVSRSEYRCRTSESSIRRQNVYRYEARRSNYATDQVLRLAGGTRGIIVDVMRASAFGLYMDADTAVVGAFDGRRQDDHRLRQCEKKQHGTQQQHVETA